MRESVAIVVVLYKAELSLFHKDLLKNGNITLIVVDNTPGRDLDLRADRLVYIPLGDNLGIATAQNEGIGQARESGCDYVIFFDQDSVIPEGYANRMVEEYKRINGLVPNLFLLGPTVTSIGMYGRQRILY